jgi:hypothetical protein
MNFFCCNFTKIFLYIKYLFIYFRSKLKLAKGQLARDEITLNTSLPPFSPKLLLLKIRKEKIQKPNKYLIIISSQNKN